MGACSKTRKLVDLWSDWKLGFTAFFLMPKGGGACLVRTNVSWEVEVSSWLIITFGEHMDLLQDTLQVPPFNDHPTCC
jgi:hypothetical protein